MTELSSADVVAFVATTDKDRAREFYESVLRLPVTVRVAWFKDPDGNTLSLHTGS